MKSISERIALAWQVLTRRAMRYEHDLQAAKIGYGDFVRAVEEKGSEENVGRQGASKYLHPIQDVCRHGNLPPLTGLVVRESKGVKSVPSSGFMGSGVLSYDEEMETVLTYRKWDQYGNPFLSKDGTPIDADSIAKSLKAGRSVLSIVQNRGYAQTLFRKGLLEAYGGKCAICEIAVEDILDAAHIKPWSVCVGDEGGELNNGILLCKNHHHAFDRAL